MRFPAFDTVPAIRDAVLARLARIVEQVIDNERGEVEAVGSDVDRAFASIVLPDALEAELTVLPDGVPVVAYRCGPLVGTVPIDAVGLHRTVDGQIAYRPET